MGKSSVFVCICFIGWVFQAYSAPATQLLCKFKQPANSTLENLEGEKVFSNGSTLCRYKRDDDTLACMAVLQLVTSIDETGNSTERTVITHQGCFSQAANAVLDCNTKHCEARQSDRNRAMFCCCGTDECNRDNNVVILPPRQDDVEEALHEQPTDLWTIFGIVCGTLVAVMAFVVISYYIYRKKVTQEQYSLRDKMETFNYERRMSSEPPSVNYDNLKIEFRLHCGRFGEVFKAKLDDRDVCVKYFHSQQHQLFLNEKDIYSVLDQTVTSIVGCLVCDERQQPDGSVQYIVIMEYIPLGSLTSYLKNHSLTLPEMCRMAQTMAAGLGYLHSETYINGVQKHAIVHRDINSRNVLVRANLTCAIADMGFALKIRGSKFLRNGQEEHAEEASLRDVGTTRYMAPEILDGAVNLRDCESSLKQIDVYAMALVLWELLSRCKDILHGSELKNYMLPFEDLIGLHPKFEVMQEHVSRNRKRPSFPLNLKDNEITTLIKETIEECWDNDADARLTALCVAERYKEIAAMLPEKEALPISVNDTCVKAKAYNVIPADPQEASPLIDTIQETPQHQAEIRTDVKPDVNIESANNRLFGPRVGRNVVAERNTLKGSSEELSVHDNVLVSCNEARIRQAADEQRQKRLREDSQQQQEIANSTNRSNPSPRRAVPFHLDVHNEVHIVPPTTKKVSNVQNARRHNSQQSLNGQASPIPCCDLDAVLANERTSRPKSLNLNLLGKD